MRRNTRLMLSLLAITVFLPGTASAGAVYSLKTIPADSVWAVAATDPGSMLEGLYPLYNRLAKAAKIMPSKEQAGEMLKEAIGFNPLDEEELANQGLDLERGIIVHGAINKRLKENQAITVSIATTNAEKLNGVLANLLGGAPWSLPVIKTKRMNGATLEFRGQRGSIGLAVATTPDWIHILSGRNEKVVRQEARRVLRKGRRFGTTAAYKAFTQVVNNGQFVVYVNMTAVTNHELRTLRAQKKTIARALRREKDENLQEMHRYHLSAIDDQVESWTDKKSVTVIGGRLLFGKTGAALKIYTQFQDAMMKKVRAAIKPATGLGFDRNALRKANPVFAEVNVSPKALIDHLLPWHKEIRDGWKQLRQLFHEQLDMNVSDDLLPLLDGPIVYVAHDLPAPPKSTDTPPSESPSAETAEATTEAATEDGVVTAQPPPRVGATGPSWEDRMNSQLQHAMLIRVSDTAPFLRLMKKVEGLIRKHAPEGEPALLTNSTVDDVEYLSWTMPIYESPLKNHLHVGIGHQTVIVGMGPNLPTVAKPWFKKGPLSSDAMSNIEVNVLEMLKRIDAFITPLAKSDAGQRAGNDDWKMLSQFWSVWSRIEASLNDAPKGFQFDVQFELNK